MHILPAWQEDVQGRMKSNESKNEVNPAWDAPYLNPYCGPPRAHHCIRPHAHSTNMWSLQQPLPLSLERLLP